MIKKCQEKQARDKYRNLLEEKKRQNMKKIRYGNMSQEKKQKLKKYQKNYHETIN